MTGFDGKPAERFYLSNARAIPQNNAIIYIISIARPALILIIFAIVFPVVVADD